LYYLLWNYRYRGDTKAVGAEVLRAVDLKERQEKYCEDLNRAGII
jgi:hypothetical protein